MRRRGAVLAPLLGLMSLGEAAAPVARHAVAPASPGGYLIVGDVHGCLDELEALLATAAHDARSEALVLVGDLVNKGPRSAAVVRWCRERRALAVRGNHEDACLARVRAAAAGAAIDASYAYVREFDAADVAYLCRCRR